MAFWLGSQVRLIYKYLVTVKFLFEKLLIVYIEKKDISQNYLLSSEKKLQDLEKTIAGTKEFKKYVLHEIDKIRKKNTFATWTIAAPR